MTDLPKCSVDGCLKSVNKAGHELCFEHWKQHNVGGEGVFLTANELGAELSVTSTKLNQILSELGWIEKANRGWRPTLLGEKLLAKAQTHSYTKIPYVVWPQDILKSRILSRAVKEFLTPESLEIELNAENDIAEYRKKFPAQIRTPDGHMVRSRAESMIDDWLYRSKIVHAYEKLLPIDEVVVCDFYIPESKGVYIEYWGLEEEKYLERKKKKQEIYKKYHYNLIELEDKHINSLDDFLPKMLLKFGIKVESD